ncbi:MAG: (2Fe-2S)-binding protein [uncultured Thiotrichaceae bacterium]|uniref:Bacterioferritin-associated ferredoxin n=1 Tax=uncultured Thiotrichaceae bacterium TaxID=298394 RepID=A0A6S6TD31_9GAMM|nr:MAG: (2Fe-2S)-binding protein [uncultured Thiotrichaceae bacterium]
MYVCICNAVTDREIKKAVKQGVNTFDQVRDQLGVASCCGQCESHAREVINEARTAKPVFAGIPLIPVSMPHMA